MRPALLAVALLVAPAAAQRLAAPAGRVAPGAASQWASALSLFFAQPRPDLNAVAPTLAAVSALDLKDPAIREQLAPVMAAATAAARVRLAARHGSGASQAALADSAISWSVLDGPLKALLPEPLRAPVGAAARSSLETLQPDARALLLRRMDEIASALRTSAGPDASVGAAAAAGSGRARRATPKEWALRKPSRTSLGVMDEVDQAYREERLRWDHEETPYLPATAARMMGRRFDQGDEHARVLVEMGFTADKDRDGATVLRMPAALDELLAAYYARMKALVASGAAAESDLIYPAVIFSRFSPLKLGREYLFVRPGLDPWPDSRWSMPNQDNQLDDRVFYEALAEGKLPLGMKLMLAHELGHLTELWAHPKIMALNRRFAREVLARRALDPKDVRPGEFLRNKILAEYLSLPDSRQAPLIRELIGHWFAASPPSLEAARRHLAGLSPERLEAHAGKLVELSDRLLLRHGGGYRDHYNVDQQYRPSDVLEDVGLALAPAVPQWPRPLKPSIIKESPHSLVLQIRMLADLRFRPESFERYPRVLSEELRAKLRAQAEWFIKAPGGRARLETLLVDRAARLEQALFAAAQTGVTPEDVFEDSRLQAPAAGSRTHRYYSMTALPGGAYERAFLDLEPPPRR